MSFPRYPNYKDSGVEWLGQVPEHWEIVAGRRLFQQKREPAMANDEQLSATQRFGVVPQKLFMEMQDQKVTLALSGIGNFKHVESGDFVISLRSFQGGIERSNYSGCVSPAYTVLRPASSVAGGLWRYLLKSKGYIEALQSITEGIRDGKNISFEQFGEIRVPVIPHAEQTSIAAFLDRETAKIDALVAEQQRLLELLKEKRQAVISHAVTKGLNPTAPMKPSGIEWLGDVPAHWELRRLRQISPRLAGRLVVQPHLYFEDEGVPIVFGNNIRRGRICQDEIKYISFEADRRFASCKVTSGDLLTVRVGEPGATAVVPPELDGCHFASTMLIRQAPTFDSNWLCHVMNSDLIDSQIALVNYGAAQEQFNIGDAANFLIPFPPRNEQTELASFLESSTGAHDALIDEAQRAIDLLQERRAALISAAVTGQIDIRSVLPVNQAAAQGL